MKHTLWLVLLAAVALGVGTVTVNAWNTVQAGGDLTTTVTVYQAIDGDECAFTGLDGGLSTVDWVQVVVTDAAGVIVGTLDITGVSPTPLDVEGVSFPVCGLSGALTLPDSSFYTFTVSGQYNRTIERSILASLEDGLFIPLR